MPFIEQNVDKSIIRPQSRSGALSQASRYKQVPQVQQLPRPRSQASLQPIFVRDDLAAKLYSSPSPQQPNMVKQPLPRSAAPFHLPLKKFQPGALVLPLELSNETAYMNKRSENKNTEFSRAGDSLGNIAESLVIKKQALSGQSIAPNYSNIPEDIPVKSSSSRPQTSSQHGDRAIYYQRPQSSLSSVQNPPRPPPQPLYSTIDKRKRLEENSKACLMQIQSSRSISSFGRQIDSKITNLNRIRVPDAQIKTHQEKEVMKPVLNDWIVQSRVGTVRNLQLKQKAEMQKQLFLESEQSKKNQISIEERFSRQEVIMKQNKNALQKRIVDSIITTAEDIIPIFKCIHQRVQMEKLLEANDNDQIVNFFKQNNISFNPSSALEAQQFGREYYDNLREKYANLLKATPDVVANSLISNEFIYLTFDTQDIRRVIIKQYLEKTTDMEGVYSVVDPNANIYELIVCSYQQINKSAYFTLSGTGFTIYRTDNEETTQIISIDDWEREKKLFQSLRRVKFISQFRVFKAFAVWKSCVREGQRVRSLSAIQRLSLLSIEQFCATLRNVKQQFYFDDRFKFLNNKYKGYTFYNFTQFLSTMFPGKKKINSKYEQYLRREYSATPNKVTTLSQFVLDFREYIADVSGQLHQIVADASDLLLVQCKQIQAEIQRRLIDSSEKQPQKATALILAAVNNASQFNMMKMRGLVKISDYMLVEGLIDYLIGVNQRLFRIFFGVKFDQPRRDDTGDDAEYVRTTLPVVPGFDVINNPAYVQKYYDSMAVDQQDMAQEHTELSGYDRLTDFVAPMQYEEIVCGDYSGVETRQFQFSVNQNETAASHPPTSGECDLTELLGQLTQEQQVEYRQLANWLTDVPLLVLSGYYPPSPLFHVQLRIGPTGIEEKPSQNDFINFIGDCMSELATVFHKAMRPYNYPKLQSFLSEATRTNNLSDFAGISVKDGLAVCEDYIQSIQQIKWGIQFTFSVIQRYECGIREVLHDFITLLSQFEYDGVHAVRSNADLLEMASRILGLAHSHQCSDKDLCLVYLMLQMNAVQIFDFYKAVLFPKLLQYRELRLNDHPEHYDTNSQVVFDLDPAQARYADELVREYTFENLISVMSVDQFVRRIEQIQRFAEKHHKLNQARNFMCFNVSSVLIYSQTIPLLTKLIYFAKMSFIQSYVGQLSNLQDHIAEYIGQLRQVPDNLLVLQEQFQFPSFTELQDSVMDFSQLVGYEEGAEAVNDKTYILLKQLKELQEDVWNWKEAHNKAANQISELSSKKGKKKKGSSIADVQDVTHESPDNISQEVLKQNVANFEEERVIAVQKTAKYQLSEPAAQLLKYLHDNFQEKQLSQAQKSIQIYNIAKTQLSCIREYIAKLRAMIKYGMANGLLNDIGNITFTEQGCQYLELYCHIKAETQYKDQVARVQDQLQQLEQMLGQFVVKKPKLYLYFQKNLLSLYIQHANAINDFASRLIFNVEAQDLILSPGVELVFGNKIHIFSAMRRFRDINQLYTTLLFNKQCKFTRIQDQIQNLQSMQDQLDKIAQQNEHFNLCLQLFEAQDFYLQDSSPMKHTEADDVIQFMQVVLDTKIKLFLNYDKLQTVIAEELSRPLMGLDFKLLLERLNELEDEFKQSQMEITSIYDQMLRQLKSIQFDVAKNRLLRLDPPMPFNYADAGEEVDENEEYEAGTYTSFSVLKVLYTAYKGYCKNFQLILLQAYANNRNAVIEQLIETYRQIRHAQDNNEYDSHLVYFRELSNANFNSISHQDSSDSVENDTESSQPFDAREEVHFNTMVQTDAGSPGILVQNKSVVSFTNFDEVSFTTIVSNCIEQFFTQQPTLPLAIALLQQLINDIPRIQTLSTISFQPRHFQEMARMMPSPDLALECRVFDVLVNVPFALGQTTIADLLVGERENPYRSLFGPGGDGVTELLLFSVVFNGRKESVIKRLETTPLKEYIKIEEASNYFFLDQLQCTYLSREYDQYQQLLASRVQVTENNQMDQDKTIKLCDSDIENDMDQENINQKSQVQQSMISTVHTHLEAAKYRLVEVAARRQKGNQFGDNYVRQYTRQLTKGGLFFEMDRFSTSISRLIFRGLYSKNVRMQFMQLVDQADHECYLLRQLSQLKKKLYSLKINLSLHIFTDELKMYTIGDCKEIVSVVSDNLIEIQTLQAQCSRLQKSNIQLAITELMQLESLCKQAQLTIYDLLNYQKQFIQLFQVFGLPTQISRMMVEETRLFQKISKQYIGQMQQIYDKGAQFIVCCTEELRQFMFNRLLPESEHIMSQLQSYVMQKRDLFNRFYFLSDQLLTQYLSIQITDQFFDQSKQMINQGIQQMFDGVGEILVKHGEKDEGTIRKLQIYGVLGKDQEPFTLADKAQINMRQPIEQWTGLLQMVMTKQLKDHSVNCFYFVQAAFYDMLKFTAQQASCMFISKQLDLLLQKFPIQSIILSRQAFISKLLTNYQNITNKSLFSKAVDPQASLGQTPKTEFKTAIDGICCLQKEICSYLISTLKQNAQNITKTAVYKLQQTILNEQQILDHLTTCQQLCREDTSQCMYIFNEEQQQFYYAHSETLQLARLCRQKGENQYLAMSQTYHYNGIPYGYEYLGLLQRLILTSSIREQYKFILQESSPLVLLAPEGHGKTSVVTDLPRHLGQFNFLLHCHHETHIQQLEQLIIGACAEGSFLSLDDFQELPVATISILATYIAEIKQVLFSKQYKIQIGGSKHKFNSSARVLITGRPRHEVNQLVVNKFRTFSLLKPDIVQICRQTLLANQFNTYQECAVKINAFFRFLQAGYVPSLQRLDVSFRKVKAILVLIDAYWQRWLCKLKQNERLAELLEPSQTNQKILKEQTSFSQYIEQFCVIQAIISLFISVFDDQTERERFVQVIKGIFDENIVCDILSQEMQTLTQLVSEKFDNAKRTLTEKSTVSAQARADNLYLRLMLTQQHLKSLDMLKQNEKIESMFSEQVVEEVDLQLMSSMRRKQLKKLSGKSPALQSILDTQNDAAEQTVMSSHQAKNYIQNIQSKNKIRIEDQYLQLVRQNNKFIVNEFIDKYVEFEQSLLIRNGVILLGRESSGKTGIWLNTLDSATNCYHVINPGYMSIEQMFGFYQGNYFIDGAVGQVIRRYISQPTKVDTRYTTSGIKYLVFDGDISVQVADYLNPVLDDSKTLELVNFEKIKIPNHIRFIFEAADISRLTPTFISRCAVVVVQRPEDFHLVQVLCTLRSLFASDYKACLEQYEYMGGDFRPRHGAKPAPHKQKRVERYKKKTQEQIIQEKMAQLLSEDYEYGNNKYMNMVKLYARYTEELAAALEAAGAVHDTVSLHSQVLCTFRHFVLTMRAPGLTPQVELRHLRSYLLFSFAYCVQQLGGQALAALLQQWAISEYRPVCEAQQIEPDTLSLDGAFYNERAFLPQRFSDASGHTFGYELLDAAHNQLPDGSILSCMFDRFGGRLAVQTPATMRTLYLLLRRLSLRRDKQQHLDSTTGYLLLLQNKIGQHFNYMTLDAANLSVVAFTDAIRKCYQIQGDSLVPKYDNMVFYIVNSEWLDKMVQSMIDFIIRWERVDLLIDGTNYQLTIRDFVVVHVRGDGYAECSQPAEGAAPTVEPQITQWADTQLTATIFMFSQMKDINPAVIPVFQSLNSFMFSSIMAVAQKFGKFSCQLVRNLAQSLLLLNTESYAKQIPDFTDPNYIIPFKRCLVETVLYLLKMEYFYPLQLTERQANQILTENAEKFLVNHVYELKPTPNLKGKVYLHRKYLFQQNCTCIAPRYVGECEQTYIRQQMSNLSRASSRKLLQHYSSAQLERYESTQLQASDLIAYNPSTTLLKSVRSNGQMQFIKPEYTSRMKEQILMNTEQSNLEQYEVGFRSACEQGKFMNVAQSEMGELCQRVQLFSYMLATKRVIVSQNIQQKLTQQLYQNVCQQLDIKLVNLQERDMQQYPASYYLVGTIKGFIMQLIEQLHQSRPLTRYCLFINHNYYSIPECKGIAREFLAQTYNVQDLYDNEVLQKLRLLYQDTAELNKLQIINMCKTLLEQNVKLIILANNDEITELQRIYLENVYYEHVTAWGMYGVTTEGKALLFRNNANSAHIDMFQANEKLVVRCFTLVVQLLSQSSVEFNNIFMTPQFFAKFVNHWFRNYAMQTARLQHQQELLSNALKVFKECSQNTQTLSNEIQALEPQLVEKQETLSNLLKQLEAQRCELGALQSVVNQQQTMLQVQVAQIDAEKGTAEAELNSVLPVLQEATQALNNMTREEAIEVGRIKEPNTTITMVASAICLLLGEQPQWSNARLVLGRGDFIGRLTKLDPRQIDGRQFKLFKQALQNANFNVERINLISRSVGTLARWAIAFGRYAEVRESVDPKLERVERLQHEYQVKSAEMEEKRKQLQELQAQLEQLDKQIQIYNHEVTVLNGRITDLHRRLSQLNTINQLLCTQHTEWQHQLGVIKQNRNCVGLHLLVLSCFNVLQINQAKISENMGKVLDLFREHEQDSQDRVPVDAQDIVDSIMPKEELLQIMKYSITNDQFSQLMLINFYLGDSSQLILDTDRQFNSYLNQVCQTNKLKLYILDLVNQSLTYAAIKDMVVKCITQGEILIVKCSLNNMPQLVQTVVQQIHFNIGCLVTQDYTQKKPYQMVIDQLKMDVHPRFELFVVDQETQNFGDLNSELLQQYNIISFQKQSETIQEQINSLIASIKSKEVQQQYLNLVQEKADIQNQYKQDQQAVLDKLNSVNIAHEQDQVELIGVMEDFVMKQANINDKITKISQLQADIEHQKRAYNEESRSLASFYNNLQKLNNYSINLFLQYVQILIDENDVQTVCRFLQHSLSQHEKSQFRLQMALQLDMDKAQDQKEQTLIRAFQHFIMKHEMGEGEGYILCEEGQDCSWKPLLPCFDESLQDMEQIENIFVDNKEAPDQAEIQRRQLVVSMLLHGLFRERVEPNTRKAQQFLSNDSVFYTGCYKCLKDPMLCETANIDDNLQKEISNSIIMNWQQSYIKLIRGDIEDGAVIDHIADQISAKYAKRSGNSYRWLPCYIRLVYSKIFAYEDFNRRCEQLASQDETPSSEYSDLLYLMKKSHIVWIKYMYGDEHDIVNSLFEKISSAYNDEAAGSAGQLELVYFYGQEQLAGGISEQTVLVINRVVCFEELMAIQQQRVHKILILNEQRVSSQLLLESCPRFYYQDVLRFCEQSQGTVSSMLTMLRGVAGEEPMEARGYLEAVVETFGRFSAPECEVVKRVELQELSQALRTAYDRLLLHYGAGAALSILEEVQFVKNLYVRRDRQEEFVRGLTLYLSNSSGALCRRIGHQQRAATLVTEQVAGRRVILGSLSTLMPLQQYFVVQACELNRRYGGRVRRFDDIYSHTQRMLSLIRDGKHIREVETRHLLSPRLFFQYLLLQAVSLYGGHVDDYGFVYGHGGSDNDLRICLTLHNAAYGSDNAIAYQFNNKQAITIRACVTRVYKRKQLILPVASCNSTERCSQQEGTAIVNTKDNLENDFIDFHDVLESSIRKSKAAQPQSDAAAPRLVTFDAAQFDDSLQRTTNFSVLSRPSPRSTRATPQSNTHRQLRPGSGSSHFMTQKELQFEKRLNQYLGSVNQPDIFKGECARPIELRCDQECVWTCQIEVKDKMMQDAGLSVYNVYLE